MLEEMVATMAAARDALTGLPRDSIWIGAVPPFEKALNDNGVTTVSDPRAALASSFLGLPIRTDARIPDGVYVMVPEGKTMLDQGVVIGCMAPEYVGAAKGFAMAIAFQRMNEGRL